MKKRVSILLLSLFFLMGCGSPQSFTVNLVVSLTGTASRIGSEVRNGVSLAVDQVNEAGGIKGREILLRLHDDENDPQKAIEIDQRLAQEGEALILGHITSGITVAAYQEIKDLPVLLFSPTSSSDQLSGIQDNFFRSILSVQDMASDLATYSRTQIQGDLVLVLDQSNRAFAQGWVDAFTSVYESDGASLYSIWISPDDVEDYHTLADQIIAQNIQGVVYVLDALNTARLSTAIRQKNPGLFQLCSTWAMASQAELLAYGGDALEGMVSVQPVWLYSNEEAYLEFSRNYNNRYKTSPSTGAIYGFEAMLVIIHALEKAREWTFPGIKEALQGLEIPGLQGSIQLDEYGDAQRPSVILQILGNTILTVESP